MEILRDYFLLFIIYSFIGWIMEVIYAGVLDKKLTNRGFLIGPICPIYGVGCVLIIILLSDFKPYPVGLFVLAVVIASLLEYYTSYLMEKIFKARWWNYSQNKFNINGRICLETMIPFGIISCLVIYIVNPFLIENLNKIPDIVQTITTIIIAIIFLADLITSFNIINHYKKTIKKASLDDNTEDINQYVKNKLLEKSVLYRRLIKAFPRIEAKIKYIIKKD